MAPASVEIGGFARVAATDAHEGPVYVPDEDALYFTTVRRERVSIKRLSLADRRITTVREDANTANGMTLDPDGRLVVCEQGTTTEPARIAWIDRETGERETVVDAWNGLPLNSPNDVVVASDGAIWFTDPSYGFLQGFRSEPQVPDRVYRWDRGTARLEAVCETLDKPNGLAFSPDERILYVGDNGAPHRLLAFDVVDGSHLTGGREVAVSTPEHPDGIKVDREGRVYATFAGGIQVFSPDGGLVGQIALPGAVNFTFGGPGLLVTADEAVWAVQLSGQL